MRIKSHCCESVIYTNTNVTLSCIFTQTLLIFFNACSKSGCNSLCHSDLLCLLSAHYSHSLGVFCGRIFFSVDDFCLCSTTTLHVVQNSLPLLLCRKTGVGTCETFVSHMSASSQPETRKWVWWHYTGGLLWLMKLVGNYNDWSNLWKSCRDWKKNCKVM